MAKKNSKEQKLTIVAISIREGDLRHQDEQATRFENLTEADLTDSFVDLEEATSMLGMKRSTYVRTLVLAGRIEGVRIKRKGYTKWYIDVDSIDYYLEHKGHKRSIRRYVLRIPPESEGAVRAVLDTLVDSGGVALGVDVPEDFTYTLELSYTGKSDDDE